MEPTTTTDLASDDAELREILGTLTKPVYPLQEIEPFGPTKLWEEANSGRLKTFVLSGRRLVFAADYARWLLLLKREGSMIKPSERPLSERARDRLIKARQKRAANQPAAA